MRDALLTRDFEALPTKHAALLAYALKVTREPSTCCRDDVDALRLAGASDEEIHATVQVAAYFNYINRVADGLGVDLEAWMPKAAGGQR